MKYSLQHGLARYSLGIERRGRCAHEVEMYSNVVVSARFKSGHGKFKNHVTISLGINFLPLLTVVRVSCGWRHCIDLSIEPHTHSSTS